MIYYHCKACGLDIGEGDVTNYNEGGVLTHLVCGQPVEERDTTDLVRKQTRMERRSRIEEVSMLDAVSRLNLGAELIGGAVAVLRSRPQMANLAVRLHLSDLEVIRDNALRIADEITNLLLDGE